MHGTGKVSVRGWFCSLRRRAQDGLVFMLWNCFQIEQLIHIATIYSMFDLFKSFLISDHCLCM